MLYRFLSRITLKSSYICRVNGIHIHKSAASIVTARLVPLTMKIDSPQFAAIFTPELETLASLFTKYGYEIRIAGGAVRDLLLNIQPHDLDFATTATPEQMKEMFIKEEVRLINAKGEKHGTITPRINDKENFEVTTLRIDVVTDGRHAEVEFTQDWRLDANRRDLTINSMFLALDGTVYDYFDGQEDLKKRRVAFVGDAVTRIQEDYLRILRYFRFYGRIALEPDCHDRATLAAIRDNAGGLARISGERVWSELAKVLAGNFAGHLVEVMVDLGLGPHIGLPDNADMATFQAVYKRSKDLGLQPIALLCGLFRDQQQVMDFHARVKLSAFERDLALFLVEHRDDKIDTNPLRPYQALVVKTAGKGKLSDVHEWAVQVLKYRGQAELAEMLAKWQVPRFPISGVMLRELGVPGGKPTGFVLQKLREYWVEHDFKPTTEQILKQVPDIQENLPDRPSRQDK